MAGLLRDGLLRSGMKPEQIEIVKSEPEAVRKAIGMALRDDLVVVFADRIAKVTSLVEFERQKEQRGGNGASAPAS